MKLIFALITLGNACGVLLRYSVLWRMLSSDEDVSTTEGYHQYCLGIPSFVDSTISNVEEYHQYYGGIKSVL